MFDTLEEKSIKEEQDKVLIELGEAIMLMPHGWSLRKAPSGQWQVLDTQGVRAWPESVREIIEELTLEII
jgi:hypothetical protein